MEQILALVVFGLLGAITVYGFLNSNRASRKAGRVDHDSRMVGVSAE